MRAWTPTNIVFQVTQHVSLPDSPMPGRARFNLVAPIKRTAWDGKLYYVTATRPHRKYSRSTHTGAYLTHVVKGVLLVWRNGKLIGSMVIWNCNQKSQTYRLTDQRGDKPCKQCHIDQFDPRSVT
jgi:hypothetical protein